MNDLIVKEHLHYIKQLVNTYVIARIELVSTKDEIDGKLGRALWGHISELPLIQIPEQISTRDIEESLLALALRGSVTKNFVLVQHADEIDTPLYYLTHLVLHEVAHIKHNWQQNHETDCDLWACEKAREWHSNGFQV
jgi:hypothetical protein